MNRGGIADLPLLKTLLAISQNTLLQWLLACLNFTLDSEDLFCWYKQKNLFLWTMTAAQAAEIQGGEWGLTWYFYEGYIHQFQPEPTHEID